MKVLLYQMDVLFGKPDDNFLKLERQLDNESEIENTLVLVPELFLTGYSKQALEQTAFIEDTGEVIDRLISICDKHKIYLYGSIAEFDGVAYYNTGVLVSSSGIVSKYRKSHLFGPMGEKSLFSNGVDISTGIINKVKFGLSICYDLRFPVMYQMLADLDIDVLLIVAEWPNTRVNHWTALLKARSIENQMFVVGLNRVGSDPDYIYGGNSAVYSPFGEFVGGILHEEEASLFLDLNLDEISEFRDKFDVREDRVFYVS